MKHSTFLFPILLVLLSPTVLSESRFKLSMKCHEDDSEYVCDELMTEFERTAEIIESNLVLNADIRVELRFHELGGGRTLGGAFPILRKYVSPHDQVERLYPPALLKQLNADIDYEYAPDIVIDINSRSKDKFWFPGDGDIKRNQVDMSLIMLHEMMHGLGFISTWDLPSTHNDFITPMLNGHPIKDDDDPITFEGFYETIFDAYIVHLEDHNDPKSAKRITDIAQSFNAFVPKGTKFDDGVEELFDTFEKSGHIENAKLMLKYATTRSDLAFMVPDSPDPPFTLYTSNRDFEIGGSINHFDENFKDTPDFLMTPSTGGGTLEAHIQRTGNNPGGGIGPKLRSILKTIGYTINENPAALPQKRRFTRRNNQRKPLISL